MSQSTWKSLLSEVSVWAVKTAPMRGEPARWWVWLSRVAHGSARGCFGLGSRAAGGLLV